MNSPTMGLSESKVILETLGRACADAENDGRDGVDSVLSEPEVCLSYKYNQLNNLINIDQFIRSLRQMWASIPPKTKRTIGRRPRRELSRNPQIKLRQTNHAKIAAAQIFVADVCRWENDPLLFFTDDSNVLDFKSSPLAQSYNYLERLERRRGTDTIRSRFFKVVYHRLRDRLCLNQLRTNNAEIVAQITSRSGIVSSDFDLIKHHVSRWTDEGRRIDAFCRDISQADSLDNSHLGNLFCLPKDIHDEL